MAEINENEIAGSDGGGNGVELAFDGVGAGGATCYGGVDDGDFEGVVEPFSSAYVRVRVDNGGVREEGVPFVPLPLPPGAMVESPARKILGVVRSSRMGAAHTVAAIAKNGTVDKDFMIEA